ncbi:hypothetical protein [Allofranklinella schreckenbergeri]|uniref:hypothetical protein n=1 Tax=Allofranklinella schreckenbergeri TaxID=1076744 RepID=UPI001EED53DF|nr:hypothetical protein [Allofranklinella schreckenbergeri]
MLENIGVVAGVESVAITEHGNDDSTLLAAPFGQTPAAPANLATMRGLQRFCPAANRADAKLVFKASAPPATT